MLAWVASVSMPFRSKERGTSVKDRSQKRKIQFLGLVCSKTTRKRVLSRLFFSFLFRFDSSFSCFHFHSSRFLFLLRVFFNSFLALSISLSTLENRFEFFLPWVLVKPLKEIPWVYFRHYFISIGRSFMDVDVYVCFSCSPNIPHGRSRR